MNQRSVWDVLMDLKRSAARTAFYFDRTNPGYVILRRAEQYLEHGELVSPGWSTKTYDPGPRRIPFLTFRTSCNERAELELIRRPANALNIEISKPFDRCRLRTPEEWRDVDYRGVRWVGSGGSLLIFGYCEAARCPRMKEWRVP